MFLIKKLDQILEGLYNRGSDWLIPTLARAVFALVLFNYYVGSAFTKFGDGVFGFLSPDAGAYVQIFPKAMEAVGYDHTQLSLIHTLIVYAGTYSEILLPILIVVGLLTRLAALGMIGFVFVQSFVDITGHGVSGRDIGSWFDSDAGSLIMDQRTFWVFLFLVLLLKGGGRYALDRRVIGCPNS